MRALARLATWLVAKSRRLTRGVLYLAFSPAVFDRLLRDDRFALRLKGSSSAWQALGEALEKDAVFERFLAAPFSRFLARVLADERFARLLIQNEDLWRAYKTAIENQELFERLRDNQHVRRGIESGSLLRAILTDPDTTAAFQRFARDPQVVGLLLRDAAVVRELVQRELTEGQFSSVLLKHPDIVAAFQRFARDPKVIGLLLQDPALGQKLVHRELDEGHVNKILSERPDTAAVFLRVARDPKIIHLLLRDDEVAHELVKRELTGKYITKMLLERPDTAEAFRSFARDRTVLEVLLQDAAWVHELAKSPGLQAGLMGDRHFLRQPGFPRQAELARQWQRLAPVFTRQIQELEPRILESHRQAHTAPDTETAILNAVCEGNEVRLAYGILRFPDRHALWIQLQELLVNEEYFFETDTEAPRIIDGGAHFGLAIYYFKTLYPKARITAFEPAPDLFALAQENVVRNNYTDVEVLPYALSDTDEDAVFLISERDSMAGSLTTRRKTAGDSVKEITVPCRRLSLYLAEPVHFLKLDIEGQEDRVLAEAAPKLSNVHQMFIEYHHGNGLPADRLARILEILEKAGFDMQVSKSYTCQRNTERRPMAYAAEPYSVTLWARNRLWPPAPGV